MILQRTGGEGIAVQLCTQVVPALTQYLPVLFVIGAFENHRAEINRGQEVAMLD